MFFKSDDNNNYDYTTICSKIQEESSKYLVVKQKPTQIKVLFNNEKNNTDNSNKKFNIKVKPKLNNIKSQGWHHS